MVELKKKVEAVLFSAGKYVSVEDIAKLCHDDVQHIKEILRELQIDYENNNSSLVVLNEGEMWKLTTREEYSHIVGKVISETELTRSQIETLAVIAFKYPIKQSDLIRIRTNKAYEHLMEMEKAGFITRKKYGRSKLIKLTDKFFEYFDLPREKLKERFMGFEQLAKTIEHKEKEIEEVKEEQKKLAEEDKFAEEKEKKIMEGTIEIIEDNTDENKLEVYDEPNEPKKEDKVEEVKEKLGVLDVVDEEEEKEDNDDEDNDDDNEEKARDTENISKEENEKGGLN